MAWTSRVGGCQGQWPGTRPRGARASGLEQAKRAREPVSGNKAKSCETLVLVILKICVTEVSHLHEFPFVRLSLFRVCPAIP